MGKFPSAPLIAAAFLMTFTAAPVWAGHGNPTVLVTALGVLDGEFCSPDRALLFEDPDGTTILWDPGRTVRGPTDDRLESLVGGAGNLDGIVLSSVHRDHLGEKFFDEIGADPDAAAKLVQCDGDGASTSTAPNSNTAEILAGHAGAFMPAAGELRGFMRAKLADAGGSSNQTNTLRPGGVRMIGGVAVAVIPAFHSNGINTTFLTGSRKLKNPAGKLTNGLIQHNLADNLKPDGLSAYVGPDNGFVLRFTNDLLVYLTADTGQFGDMKTIVKEFYVDHLAATGLVVVVNMGGIFSMGPVEAAWAVETLLDADAVIPSHANQVSTIDGATVGSNLTDFISAITTTPVHVPLSGLTMEFDNTGFCVSGPSPC